MNSYLSKVRAYYQLSQGDLAQLLETSRSSIAMMENYLRPSFTVSGSKFFLLLDRAMQLNEKRMPSSENAVIIKENKLLNKLNGDLQFKLLKAESTLENMLKMRLENERAKLALEDILNSYIPEDIDDYMYAWLKLQIRLKAGILATIKQENIKLTKVKIAGFKAMIEELQGD